MTDSCRSDLLLTLLVLPHSQVSTCLLHSFTIVSAAFPVSDVFLSLYPDCVYWSTVWLGMNPFWQKLCCSGKSSEPLHVLSSVIPLIYVVWWTWLVTWTNYIWKNVIGLKPRKIQPRHMTYDRLPIWHCVNAYLNAQTKHMFTFMWFLLIYLAAPDCYSSSSFLWKKEGELSFSRAASLFSFSFCWFKNDSIVHHLFIDDRRWFYNDRRIIFFVSKSKEFIEFLSTSLETSPHYCHTIISILHWLIMLPMKEPWIRTRVKGLKASV